MSSTVADLYDPADVAFKPGDAGPRPVCAGCGQIEVGAYEPVCPECRKPLEAKAKHLLREASHALDSASIRVHRKRDGWLIINARGKSRFMTLRERIAYWLLKQSTEIQP